MTEDFDIYRNSESQEEFVKRVSVEMDSGKAKSRVVIAVSGISQFAFVALGAYSAFQSEWLKALFWLACGGLAQISKLGNTIVFNTAMLANFAKVIGRTLEDISDEQRAMLRLQIRQREVEMNKAEKMRHNA